MLVASIVLPLMLFFFAGWVNYRNERSIADERIERSLDILHEHTLKVFQTVERSIAEVNEIVRGMPDEEIREQQPRLHERIKRIVEDLPQLRAIFLIDRDARPLLPANSCRCRATSARASAVSSACTWPATSVLMSAKSWSRGCRLSARLFSFCPAAVRP